MAYGIKKASNTPSGKPSILTTNNDWVQTRFVGIGAYAAKEWKTRAGADRAAKRFGGEVFTITTTMNY